MILSFLLIFAFLTLAVVKQLETRQDLPELPTGHCPGCGGRIEFDWLICPRCKELLQRPCEGCGERLPFNHHFCTSCGTPNGSGKRGPSACI